MSEIPDAAIEAAAKAICARFNCPEHQREARVAVEAAMPAIREAIAQEIEGTRLVDGNGTRSGLEPLLHHAACIVRGGAA